MLHFSGNCGLAAEGFTEVFAAEDPMSRYALSFTIVLVAPWAMAACGGAASSKAAAPAVAEPAPVASPVTPPASAAPTAAEVSAQVRSARAACNTEATKQQYEVVDFVTFNRLDDNNWDAVIRARQKGKLLRIGCRYDLRAATSYVYSPPSVDGGNPWGPAGAPKASAPPAAATNLGESRPASGTRTEAKPEAKKPETKPETKPEPKPPAPKPVPGANINLNAVPDTSARAAIARTRDACLAEAARRKIAFDDFDAFRRVAPGQWEAMLLVKSGKGSSRSCRVVLDTGKATIK
jgi:hypothetical protein